MSNDPFRVAVVGCGVMANAWVETAVKAEGVEVVALIDLRPEAAGAMADRHGLPRSVVFGSLAQAIAVTRPDVVFDVTIPEAHEGVVTEALRAGCHVMGEKPLSTTIASAQRMVAAAQQAGRVYAVMQNRRADANLIAYANFIHERLGGLDELHADMFIGAHFGGFRDLMDYPLLLDMAIHTFDAARFIARADPVSVYCHSFNPRRSWYKGDASAICIFEMGNGLVFTYRGSWCAEGLHADWNGQWRAIGTNGTATWVGQNALRAQLVQPGGKHGFFSEMTDHPITPTPLPLLGHAGLITDFLACLRDGRTPQTICTDNIKSLAMVEAAVQSARSGAKVKVEW